MSDIPILAWIGIAVILISTAFNVKYMIRDYKQQIKEIKELIKK